MDEKEKCFHPECGCQKDELPASLVEQLVMQRLDEGYHIGYAPISGGLGMFKDGKKEEIDMKTFLKLREDGNIEFVNTMRQGHMYFHGRVDFYKKSA